MDDDAIGMMFRCDELATRDGPSSWSAKSGALVQSSNFGGWSTATGTLGTFVAYKANVKLNPITGAGTQAA